MIFDAIIRSITSYVTNNCGKNGSKKHENVKVIFLRLLSILLQVYILIILVLSFALVFCNNGIIDSYGYHVIGIAESALTNVKKKTEEEKAEEKRKAEMESIKKGEKVIKKAEGLEPYLYFSMITFTTVGYGDFKPSKESRLLATLEAFLGYTYLGLLLGLILLKLSDIHKKTEESQKTEGFKTTTNTNLVFAE